jgi:hypothetical protein
LIDKKPMPAPQKSEIESVMPANIVTPVELFKHIEPENEITPVELI